MYFSVLQCKCIFSQMIGNEVGKTSLKSNLEYLLVQIRPNYFDISLSSFLLKKVYFLSITQCRHVTRRKMGGARICGLCVFCSAFNSFTNFFFLLVTTPGVIIKREFNSKLYQKLSPESQSH